MGGRRYVMPPQREITMQEYDRVELTAEKECYAKDGVHKGMNGWICDPRNINGSWLVSFDQYGELDNIATIPVKEVDLKIFDPPEDYDVHINTRIAEAWGES